jgi:hypothetical protein
MKIKMIERTAEYLLSTVLVGLAIFLLREIWLSFQVLELIYQQLLEGSVFTEGPPIPGIKEYLLFSLYSAFWSLVIFGFLLSRRFYPLWVAQISFYLLPVWVILFTIYDQRADYQFTSIGYIITQELLASWQIIWLILSIVVAGFGGKYCRSMREKSVIPA